MKLMKMIWTCIYWVWIRFHDVDGSGPTQPNKFCCRERVLCYRLCIKLDDFSLIAPLNEWKKKEVSKEL